MVIGRGWKTSNRAIGIKQQYATHLRTRTYNRRLPLIDIFY